MRTWNNFDAPLLTISLQFILYIRLRIIHDQFPTSVFKLWPLFWYNHSHKLLFQHIYNIFSIHFLSFWYKMHIRWRAVYQKKLMPYAVASVKVLGLFGSPRCLDVSETHCSCTFRTYQMWRHGWTKFGRLWTDNTSIGILPLSSISFQQRDREAPTIHYVRTTTKKETAKNLAKKWQTANQSRYTNRSLSEFWQTSHGTRKIPLTFRQKTVQSKERWQNTKCKKNNFTNVTNNVLYTTLILLFAPFSQ